ncbi:hypothetical protein, partial [Bacteroides caecigallinarum]|uniref:hypothetical protein n=1 Tax=Bacteroides caecigallinarum TaxID=1411144 RepID=UPI001F289B17
FPLTVCADRITGKKTIKDVNKKVLIAFIIKILFRLLLLMVYISECKIRTYNNTTFKKYLYI